MFKVHQVKVHIFGIPKSLQKQQNADTDKVGIIITTVTLKYIYVFFKGCSN